MAARSSWSGTIEFGLITIPVKLYRKTSSASGVSFRQLNAKTGNPISHKKIDSVTGEPATELTKGYEIEKGTMIEMSIDEVKEMLPDRSTKLEVINFIDVSSVESERLDKPYTLQVDENFQRSYSLMTQAMAKTGKAALCRIVMSSKECLMLLRAKDSQIVANTLHWDEQIRNMESTRASEVSGEELDLAVKLVEQQATDTVDFSELTEEFKAKVQELAKEKLENGGESVTPKTTKSERQNKELDLLAALQASIGE